MNSLVKVRLKDRDETIYFPLYGRETVLSMVKDQTENEGITEADYDVLPDAEVTTEEWKQHIENELESMNWHSASEYITAAFDFMEASQAAKYAAYLIENL